MRKLHQKPQLKCSGFAVALGEKKSKIMRESVHISNFMRKPRVATLRKSLWSVHIQCCMMKNEAFDVDPKKSQSSPSTQLNASMLRKPHTLEQSRLIKCARHCHNGWKRMFCIGLRFRNSVYLCMLIYSRLLLAEDAFVYLRPSLRLS